MTLKEKFKQWFINDEEDEHYEGMVELVSIEHEKIAEDFAIGFALWKETIEQDDNGMYYSESRAHVSRLNPVNIKQLLEIYKDETTNK